MVYSIQHCTSSDVQCWLNEVEERIEEDADAGVRRPVKMIDRRYAQGSDDAGNSGAQE